MVKGTSAFTDDRRINEYLGEQLLQLNSHSRPHPCWLQDHARHHGPRGAGGLVDGAFRYDRHRRMFTQSMTYAVTTAICDFEYRISRFRTATCFCGIPSFEERGDAVHGCRTCRLFVAAGGVRLASERAPCTTWGSGPLARRPAQPDLRQVPQVSSSGLDQLL